MCWNWLIGMVCLANQHSDVKKNFFQDSIKKQNKTWVLIVVVCTVKLSILQCYARSRQYIVQTKNILIPLNSEERAAQVTLNLMPTGAEVLRFVLPSYISSAYCNCGLHRRQLPISSV